MFRNTGRGMAPLPPVFGRSVNPIIIREADYAQPITTCPPDFWTMPSAVLKAFISL